MGNIGRKRRRRTLIPADVPGKRREEVPQQVPAAPVKAPEREPEKVAA